MEKLTLTAIMHIPLVQTGDSVGQLIVDHIDHSVGIEDNDIIVIAQKIVSKAEGAVVELSSITPSQMAIDLAQQTGRDPRMCQLYLDEAKELIAVKGRMVITRHKLGYVGSSSGVDRSNIAPYVEEKVVLLPKDPDASARGVREYIQNSMGKTVAVIINDSCGRDHRGGSVGMAIGIAGIGAIEYRNRKDLFGNPSNSQIALIDELAAAASILMGQADEAVPAVLVRGVTFTTVERAHIADFLHRS